MKSILDPAFRYTPSVSTDVRKTFARFRRMQREEAERAAADDKANAAALRTVVPLPVKAKGTK